MKSGFLLRLFLLIFTFFSAKNYAQEILIPTENELKREIIRNDKNVLFELPITVNMPEINPDPTKNYILKIQYNADRSTLPKKDYYVKYDSAIINNTNFKHTFYINIKPDSLEHDTENLVLDIKVTNKETQTEIASSIDFKIVSKKNIKDFDYLAFIGTNFDLVEGIKPNNLYFSTNMFLRPDEFKALSFGFNFFLYGNRTISITDTISRNNFYDQTFSTPTDSTYRFHRYSAVQNINYTSDNIGAKFSPLIYIVKFSDFNQNTRLYLAPQFEFIWRRMKRVVSTVDQIFIDSVDFKNDAFDTLNFFNPHDEVLSFSKYDFYFNPVGLMLVHENDYISVKIHGGFGWRYSYLPNRGNFFDANFIRGSIAKNIFVRAWITEPLTGISIGAEATNLIYLKTCDDKQNIYQPFYNITLSKAFHLSDLAGIFSPLTRRSTTNQ